MAVALNALPDECCDLVIADPPYGETSLAWDRWPAGWPAHVLRVLKPSGSMWVFGSLRMFMRHAGDFASWRFVQDVVWEKQAGSGFMRDRFRRVHEQAVMFRRADSAWADIYREAQVTFDAKAKDVQAKRTKLPHTGDIGPHHYVSVAGGPRLMRSVLRFRNCHRRGHGHPTQKPEDLVATLIRYGCPQGGLVLDPFAGSGTTGAAAISCGRSAVLIEAHAPYAQIIRRRLVLPSGAAA